MSTMAVPSVRCGGCLLVVVEVVDVMRRRLYRRGAGVRTAAIASRSGDQLVALRSSHESPSECARGACRPTGAHERVLCSPPPRWGHVKPAPHGAPLPAGVA